MVLFLKHACTAWIVPLLHPPFSSRALDRSYLPRCILSLNTYIVYVGRSWLFGGELCFTHTTADTYSEQAARHFHVARTAFAVRACSEIRITIQIYKRCGKFNIATAASGEVTPKFAAAVDVTSLCAAQFRKARERERESERGRNFAVRPGEGSTRRRRRRRRQQRPVSIFAAAPTDSTRGRGRGGSVSLRLRAPGNERYFRGLM